MTSFNLKYLFKNSSPNIVTLGVRAPTCEFGRVTNIYSTAVTLSPWSPVHWQAGCDTYLRGAQSWQTDHPSSDRVNNSKEEYGDCSLLKKKKNANPKHVYKDIQL